MEKSIISHMAALGQTLIQFAERHSSEHRLAKQMSGASSILKLITELRPAKVKISVKRKSRNRCTPTAA
jgi:hypothetical protein